VTEPGATNGSPGTRRGTLPLPFRLAERAGAALRACGFPIAVLTEDSVLRQARRATGVRDIADERFREPLRMVLAACARDPNVNLIGKIVLRDCCLQAVKNRLRIQRIVESYPEIRDVPLSRPLVVTGLHRTGTTLLHNLLAQAPGARAPRLWELLAPAPDPAWLGASPDPRLRAARAHIRRTQSASPGSQAVHDLGVDSPEECLYLFQNCFTSEHYQAFAEVPEYQEWLASRPMIEEYHYYRLQLQILLWQRSGSPLVLKWPFHAYHLRALLTVFPDADVVFTHRDPAVCVASLCSLALRFRLAGNHRIDVPRLGAWCVGLLGGIADRATSVRRETGRDRFVDVAYDDLLRDPVGTVRRVYRCLGRPLVPRTEERAEDWLRAHPQDKFGRHRYDLAEFGLSAAAVRERFGAYSAELAEHSGVPPGRGEVVPEPGLA
jgi:hypothetical protein